MISPNGTKVVGKKGRSGRKSKYQEMVDAEMLSQMFLEELDKEEVRKKIASGKYSLKDVWVSKGYAGNERVLSEIFRKLFPDNIDVKSGGKPIIQVAKEILIKNGLASDTIRDSE